MSNNKFSTGKTGMEIYGAGAPKTTDTPEAYEEYLSTPAAKEPLHGFFAVYRMRTPDGVHTTKKKPCNKDGHTKEVDAKTRTETGGVNLFTSTAAGLMDVYNSPRKSAVIATVRGNLTYAAKKRQEEAWENEYHARNGACQAEYMNMPAAVQSAAWDAVDEAEKTSAEARAELEYLRTVEISLLLGRRFDASIDGIIALDCDGHHPPEDFDTDAIYREVSASGTGTHILYRVPKDLIPDTSGNKIKSIIAGREYELFYGQGNGLAISGKQATANPDAPILDMGSPAGEIITQLIHSGDRRANFPATRMTAGREPQAAPPEVDFSKLEIPGPNEEPKTPDLIVVRTVRRTPKGGMLWSGLTTGYKSQSEADAALMVMLADACDYNIYQMERLFLQSGLAKRDKAQNRPDYIRRTAIHAIQYVYAEELKIEARIADLPKWMRKGMLRYTRNPYQVSSYQGSPYQGSRVE